MWIESEAGDLVCLGNSRGVYVSGLVIYANFGGDTTEADALLVRVKSTDETREVMAAIKCALGMNTRVLSMNDVLTAIRGGRQSIQEFQTRGSGRD